MVCWRSLHLVRGIGFSYAEFRNGRHLCLSPAYIISGENNFGLKSSISFSTWIFLGQKWESNPLLHQKSRKSSDAQQQCPLFCFSWETQNPIVPFNFFHFQAELDLYAVSCPSPCTCLHSLRPLCHPCPFLQTVSSFGKLCLWQVAHKEQELSQDSVQARRCLGSQTGNRHSQGMESACQKVQRCFWDRARCCCHYWCAFAGCVCCNENKDLKCQIWTSGGWRQTISFPFPTKKCNKTPWFLFLWGRCWWRDPSDGLAAGLHEGVIFTGS